MCICILYNECIMNVLFYALLVVRDHAVCVSNRVRGRCFMAMINKKI